MTVDNTRRTKRIMHGLAKTPEYNSWVGMRVRCHYPKNPQYPHYGGRGISVCDRWRYSYPTFLADVGRKPHPKASLGRINNDGNYEPGNVRWETMTQQMRNTRRSVFVSVNGERKTLSAWAEQVGIDRKTFAKRIKNGWPEESLLLPGESKYKTAGIARPR